jgi:UDP-2,4-diacetamido-2,4,6-trideoxy-beta-L-altropyranose hydrolase
VKLPTTILFRTDASVRIGIGHVVRCLTLADELSRLGGKCHFLSRELSGNLAEKIQARGYPVMLMPVDEPIGSGPAKSADRDVPPHASWLEGEWEDDAVQTCRLAAAIDADWVVVDHYSLDARWERIVRGRKARIAAVDDLADRAHEIDLLIDPNYGHVKDDYRDLLTPGTRALCGSAFALLRPEFAATRARSMNARLGRAPRTVLVFMGGADAQYVTLKILHALRLVRLPPGARILVVMGKNAPALEQVKNFIAQSDLALELLVDVPDMAMLMEGSDIAVGAAGTSAWERCCVGLPSVVLKCAANQATVVEALSSTGAAIAINDASAENIAGSVQQLLDDATLRRRLAEVGISLIDGLGVRRVALAMFIGQVSLRKATMNDAVLAHSWRNAEITRRYFRNPSLLSQEEHLDWWRKRIDDASSHLLIAHCGAVGVGVIRFDVGADVAEVSIYIDPDLHGFGLGSQLLELGCDWLTLHEAEVVRLVAEIHPENAASIKAFRAVGFSTAKGNIWKLEIKH